MPVETPGLFRLILDFPFDKLDRWLEENYDYKHTEARSIITSLKHDDPVLLETIRGWEQEDEKDYGLYANSNVAFGGSVLCYLYLKERAKKKGQTLPSFTTLGKKPEHGIKSAAERKKVSQEMEADDPELAQSLGNILYVLRSMEFATFPGNNDPIELHGAFVVEGALKCYAAFRNVLSHSR